MNLREELKKRAIRFRAEQPTDRTNTVNYRLHEVVYLSDVLELLDKWEKANIREVYERQRILDQLPVDIEKFADRDLAVSKELPQYNEDERALVRAGYVAGLLRFKSLIESKLKETQEKCKVD